MPENTTKFSEIYKRFLGQIDDYELGMVSDEEFEEVVSSYFENSFESLQELEVDLENIDIENKDFGVKLSHIEKTIIAKAMALEWVRTRILRAELMERDIGDRDHRAVQGDRFIRELIPLEAKMDEDVRQMIIDYSYWSTI